MQAVDLHKLMLLGHDEFGRRLNKIRAEMATSEIPALLISDNANKYYLTGRVYAGYVYIPIEGPVIFFIRRPVELEGAGVAKRLPKASDLTHPKPSGLNSMSFHIPRLSG